MGYFKNEQALVDVIQKEIRDTNKQKIKIFAGHLPLLYHDEGSLKAWGEGQRSVELGVDRWGEFSTHTFDLGCRLANYAINQGKDADLMLVVDDDVELPKIEKKGRFVRKDYRWAKKPRQRLLKEGILPEEYLKILDKEGLTEEYLLRQIRGGGMTTPLISEKILKKDAITSGEFAPNECSLAYKGLLTSSELFDTNTDYLVSFIPGQCKGNLYGMLGCGTDLDSTHIFFPHAETMGGFLQELDIKANPMKLEEIYKTRGVSFVKFP